MDRQTVLAPSHIPTGMSMKASSKMTSLMAMVATNTAMAQFTMGIGNLISGTAMAQRLKKMGRSIMGGTKRGCDPGKGL